MPPESMNLAPAMVRQWEALQARGIKIPKQPEVLLRIEEMSRSAAVQGRHLAALVRQDPGLTARLLDIVNSPAYGLAEKLQNIESAIIMLGVDRTLNLCRAALLKEALGDAGPAQAIFWDRSAIIAEMTAAIAYRQGVRISTDLAYLTGLFHACGVPVLMNAVPGYGQGLEGEAEWLHLGKHDEGFAADHVLVSYLLCSHWHLPDQVAEAVLQQHGFSDCRPECPRRAHCQTPGTNAPTCAGLVASLQLALLIYCRMFLGSPASEWEPTRAGCLATLGMTDSDLAKFA